MAAALRTLDASVRSRRGWGIGAPVLGVAAQTVVDAQLLSEREFREVLQELQRQGAPRASMVAAILGYRCGLRRTEIRGLRWIDVQWQPQPLLFVRSHAGRALKRDSGRRVLSLSAFCSKDELDRIRQERDATQKLIDAGEANRDTVLLLPDPDEPELPLAEGAVFDPITEAMQAVCGDPSLRFHHLRHSAANHLLLQLMGDQVEGAARLLDADGAISEQSIAARRRALVGIGDAQRPLLWAVAAFMGHATPETTLGSYVHLLDALLGLSVRQASPQPSAEVLGWLVGATANHVNVQHHRWGVDTPWPALCACWIHRRGLQQRLPVPTVTTRGNTGPVGRSDRSGAAPPPEPSALLNITDALDLLAVLSKDPSSPKARRHVSAAQAQRIHDWMTAWSALRGKSPRLRAQ
ncbi:MAG: tyrosine-type recombinase/integrase, partial [Thiomonas sp.]